MFAGINLSNFKETGCLPLDMAARCIIHYRQRGKYVNEIVFSKAYYDILKRWTAKNIGEEDAEKEFYLDGVKIRQETIISGRSITWFYESAKGQEVTSNVTASV